MANPNFQLLVDAAKLLKPILGELVFVRGCTTALLITDKAAADVCVRPPTHASDLMGLYGGVRLRKSSRRPLERSPNYSSGRAAAL